MKDIYLHNTLTGKKERLETAETGKIKMYVSGPTTYNFIHLGNARPMVVFDTIRRYLEYRGFEVNYIQNFTDIDDKIINKAGETGEAPLKLAEKYIKEYEHDAKELNVKPADVHPLVSRHIPEIIEMISGLIEKGAAYELDGDVYFSVRKFPGYGKLSGRSLDEMFSGARVNVNVRKKDPLDFALWKAARPKEPSWDSPWGKGRPGWHIECSTMAKKYLGEDFDIHGGGFDLVFPHHENERAQAEAYAGTRFCKYWLHNGMITVKEEKMSKSLGNFFLVREILERYPGEIIRFYLLSTHYRSPLDFDYDKLKEAGKGLDRIKTSYKLIREMLEQHDLAEGKSEVIQLLLEKTVQDFNAAMDDDFNTALAYGVVFYFCREVNSYLCNAHLYRGDLEDIAVCYRRLVEDVLGIRLAKDIPASGDDELVEDLLDIIIGIRQKARKNKDWSLADDIRDRLNEINIVLEDTPKGVRWKRK